MTPQQVAIIETLVDGFQRYAMTEMLLDWLRCQRNPSKVVNDLLFAWRDSMRANFEAQWKRHFEDTGIIVADRQGSEAMLRDAETVIRKRLEARLRAEPDGQLIDPPDPDKIETSNAPN